MKIYEVAFVLVALTLIGGLIFYYSIFWFKLTKSEREIVRSSRFPRRLMLILGLVWGIVTTLAICLAFMPGDFIFLTPIVYFTTMNIFCYLLTVRIDKSPGVAVWPASLRKARLITSIGGLFGLNLMFSLQMVLVGLHINGKSPEWLTNYKFPKIVISNSQ